MEFVKNLGPIHWKWLIKRRRRWQRELLAKWMNEWMNGIRWTAEWMNANFRKTYTREANVFHDKCVWIVCSSTFCGHHHIIVFEWFVIVDDVETLKCVCNCLFLGRGAHKFYESLQCNSSLSCTLHALAHCMSVTPLLHHVFRLNNSLFSFFCK